MPARGCLTYGTSPLENIKPPIKITMKYNIYGDTECIYNIILTEKR